MFATEKKSAVSSAVAHTIANEPSAAAIVAAASSPKSAKKETALTSQKLTKATLNHAPEEIENKNVFLRFFDWLTFRS